MDIGTWDTNKNTAPQLPVVNNTVPKSLAPNINVRGTWTGPIRAQSQPQNSGLAARPNMPPPSPHTQHMHTQQSYMAAAAAAGQPPNPAAPNPAVMVHPVNQLAAAAAAAASQVSMQQQSGPMGVSMAHVPGLVAAGPAAGQPAPQQQQQMVTGGPGAGVLMPQTPSHPVLDELRVKNNYNPAEFDLSAPNARFFVIKSYSEDDIHRSIKYEIWCSTEHGNKRLDMAYREREKEPNGCVYLFFSVNGSGHFCGMAQMVSPVDYNCNSSVWSQDKWKGQFRVRWIYVKDVPNVQLRHIRLENNENKPVTNSRDTQEVPHVKGQQVLRILHTYRHSTSIFDDFVHYEKRQEEEDSRKLPERETGPRGGGENHHGGGGGGGGGHRGGGRNHHGGDRDSDSGAGHRQGHRSNDSNHHHSAGSHHHNKVREILELIRETMLYISSTCSGY